MLAFNHGENSDKQGRGQIWSFHKYCKTLHFSYYHYWNRQTGMVMIVKMASTKGEGMRFHSCRITCLCWQKLWDFWNITSKKQVSLLCFLAWFVIQDVNPLNTFLQLRWLYQMQTITLPFISSRIGDIVQEDYARMVDLDKDILFQMHAAADLTDINHWWSLPAWEFSLGKCGWVYSIFDGVMTSCNLIQQSWLKN